jgi:dTDP-glucose pyrophosphorylase
MPKALIPINNRPLIHWVLRGLLVPEIEEILLVVGYRRKQIMHVLGCTFEGKPINYVVQKQQLGTAHAIMVAESHVRGSPFLVVNGDVVFSRRCVERIVQVPEGDVVIGAASSSQPERFGALELDRGKVMRVREKDERLKGKHAMVCVGIYRFSPALFDVLSHVRRNKKRKELELTDAINMLAKCGTDIRMVECTNYLHVGTLEELEYARKKLAESPNGLLP